MAVLNVFPSIGALMSFVLSGVVYKSSDDPSLTTDELNASVIADTRNLIYLQNLAYFVLFVIF